MSNQYDKGDRVRISTAFTDSDGTAFDPNTVTAKYLDPSSNTTTYVYGTDAELVKDSTGNYHVDIYVDEIGRWHYRFEGTDSSGNEQGADENYFEVIATKF